jgi:hypothetical protein
MAVPLRDRTENDFTLIGKSQKLLAEVIRVVKCGKRFPKRQISTFGNPIVEDFRKLAQCIAIANQYDLYDPEERAKRKAFQDKARQYMQMALVDVNTLAAVSTQAIESLSNAVRLLDDCEKLLKGWTKSDASRVNAKSRLEKIAATATK